jgi:cobalt-zinc-cadmium efflux system protein
MAHDHSHHGHAHGAHGHHDHTVGASARALGWALALTSAFLIAEVAGAFWFNSLALLSDAGHMLTDVAALAIALAAIKVGQRPADDSRTFGYRRLEVLAAAFNALMLFAVAIYVCVEAIDRIREPQHVATTGMLAIATLGLVVNLIAMRLLSAGREHSVNVKGAYLEVWADMLGSLGVIAGAVAIKLTGWLWIDIVVAVGIGLWVLPRTWSLLKDTTQLLMQGVPPGIDLAQVRVAIEGIDGVASSHDLHIWATATDEVTLTVHLVLSGGVDHEAVRLAVEQVLADRFRIGHVTIQTERTPCVHTAHA